MEYPSPLSGHGLKFINSAGVGEKIASTYGVTGAIIIPSGTATVETCGQIGCNENLEYPTDLTEEVLLAFENAEKTLHAAGVKDGWQAVYKMTSYHVGDIDDYWGALEVAVEKYLGSHRPAWTGVGVVKLAGKTRIEIAVTAVLGK